MNRKKFLCLVATLIPTTACGQFRESVAVDHPFASWSLDERDSDVARNLLGGPHGKFVAGVNSRPGVSGSAANFSGKPASRVEVAMSGNVNRLFNDVLNGSFTLELWLLDAAPKADRKTNHSLIYKADRTAFTRNSLWLYRARQDAHYHFRIQGKQDRSIQLTIRNPAGRDMAGDSRWHHVVIVIDRNNPKPQGIAYLDGKQVDRADIAAAVAINNTGPLIIGNNHYNASPWLGGIDEVSIYDAALSAERIKQHFAAGQRELERGVPKAARVTPADFFELKIRPLLIAKCATCHSGDADSESVLAVNSRRALLTGGDFGPAIIPGRSEDSLLIHAVRRTHKELHMPPDQDDSLSKAEIADLVRWIDDGAVWPGHSKPPAKIDSPSSPAEIAHSNHWSLQPRHVVEPPDVSGARWQGSPIDRFLEAKREAAQVTAATRADRRTLIRRATFDLTGLPPTPAEVRAFLQDADADPIAFARVVDRLLASRHYGERQGRHWLDVARYADTQGDVGDYPIPTAYLYRNWVIDAANRDMPFNDFLRAQVAGDILAREVSDPAAARELVIATGFLALSRRFGNTKKDDLPLTIEDTIDSIGRGVLGLTLRCARCHDHKFDAILNADYYRLYGIFESTTYPWMGASNEKSPSDLAPVKRGEESRKAADTYWALITRYEYQINNHFRPWLKPTLDEFRDVNQRLARATQQAGPRADAKSLELKQQREELLGRYDGKFRELMLHGLKWIKDEKLRLAKSPPVEFVFAVSDGKPHDARLHRRGNPKNLGDVIPRGFVQALTDGPVNIQHGSGRLELAGWLTRDSHPLTARVIVNRVWQQHFGRGLVETADNFGRQGTPPTHPELLDWLAEQFVREGWSLKKLHRRIMLSESYALASDGDGPSHLLTRFSRRRLDAEEIRDAMLAVSGMLDRTQGQAHPFRPWYEARYSLNGPFNSDFPTNRRSVYMMTQRLFRNPFFALFDGPDRNSSTSRRTTASVPSQALYLMNSPFVKQQAEALSKRLLAGGGSEESRVNHLYQLAYGRLPDARELAAIAQFLARYRDASAGVRDQSDWLALCRTVLTSNEFFFVD